MMEAGDPGRKGLHTSDLPSDPRHHLCAGPRLTLLPTFSGHFLFIFRPTPWVHGYAHPIATIDVHRDPHPLQQRLAHLWSGGSE